MAIVDTKLQDTRAFGFSLPELVGNEQSGEQLTLEGFEMTERISGLFSMHVRLSTKKIGVPAQDVLGLNAVVRAELPDSPHQAAQQRFFSGMIARFGQTDADNRKFLFDAEVVPWLWLLSQKSDCRVFQDMSVMDVVLTIFMELEREFPHLVNYADHTRNCGQTKRDCIVQYNETYLSFVSRLLEEEGVYYYFEHHETNHSVVLRDDPNRFDTVVGKELARFSSDPNAEPREDTLIAWRDQVSIVPGNYAVGDHYFQLADGGSQGRLTSSVPTKFTTDPNDSLEIYEPAAGFSKPFSDDAQTSPDVADAGHRMVRLRIEGEETERHVIHGTSGCRAFMPGYQFHRNTPEGRRDSSGPYLLMAIQHSANQPSRLATRGRGGEFTYHNTFACIPTTAPFRPARLTPRPTVHSTQTAIVIGPQGDESPSNGDSDEEIHVDSFGRVKVRFHWDRRGKADDGRTSAWVRVGQGWASGGFGMHFWPRVGDEVIVAFLNGDPDCPIIVGSVYNSRNKPPYSLPEEKTKSGIKTRSTKKGDGSNFNEIRFEDKKGKEQVYIHAERSLRTVVEASEIRSVGASRDTTVHVDDNLTVKTGDRTAYVEEGDDILGVLQGSRITKIDVDDTLIVFAGNRDTEVLEGNDNLKVPLGVRDVQVRQYEAKAKERICLKVGAGQILMEPDRIELSFGATKIELSAAGLKAIAKMIESQAVGLHDIKGLPIKMNC